MSKEDSNEHEAKTFVNFVTKQQDMFGRDDIKSLVEDVALKHHIHVYLGDYGNWESLQLEDSKWSGSRGDWISSSDNC